MSKAGSLVECVSCRLPKASESCPLCGDSVCGRCSLSLPTGAFAYMPVVPANCKHGSYCPRCYDSTIAPEFERYEAMMEQARQVSVIPKAYKGLIPFQAKARVEIAVRDCVERNEVILKLAYLAVSEGHNALVRAEFIAEKVRNHGYQKSVWKGQALPATIDQARLELEESKEEVWRRGN